MIKQPIYKNRIEVVCEEFWNLSPREQEFIIEVGEIKDEDLTEEQKKRINMLYVNA
jgi:hypothetical protein